MYFAPSVFFASGTLIHTVLIRYCDDQFDSESSTATIGVDFKVSKATEASSKQDIES